MSTTEKIRELRAALILIKQVAGKPIISTDKAWESKMRGKMLDEIRGHAERGLS